MPRVFVVDVSKDPTGRRRIAALIQWGGSESLNPPDVGLRVIESILLTPQNITPTQQPFPIGSVYYKGASGGGSGPGTPGGAGKLIGGQPGSTITLRWAQGSTGTRLAVTKAFGTLSTGTKFAHALMFGW